MAVTFIKERKKQKYFIIAFGTILLISGIILWLGYFEEKEPSAPPVFITSYKEIKIDFEVLENPFLKKIQPFEKIPPFENGKGRENPFLPY